MKVEVDREVLITGPFANRFLVRKEKDDFGREKGRDLSGADLVGKMGKVVGLNSASATIALAKALKGEEYAPFAYVKVDGEKLALRFSEFSVVR
ncbi:MAG: hypothetical protein ACOYBJ_02195 [Patescibacteria group bacterium]|jgi:hypothetical protein